MEGEKSPEHGSSSVEIFLPEVSRQSREYYCTWFEQTKKMLALKESDLSTMTDLSRGLKMTEEQGEAAVEAALDVHKKIGEHAEQLLNLTKEMQKVVAEVHSMYASIVRFEDGKVSTATLAEEVCAAAATSHACGSALPQATKVGRKQRSAEKPWCSHVCHLHQEVLNPELWKSLPDNLVEKVLAHLPLTQILELQEVACVRKAWESPVLAKSFQQAFAQSREDCVGLVLRCELPYDLDAESVGQVLVHDSVAMEWVSVAIEHHAGFYGPVAAAGGLLVYASTFHPWDVFDDTDNHIRLRVYNPMTEVYRNLPPTLEIEALPKFVHMALDEKTRAYKIWIVGDETDAMEVYDSATNLWTIATADSVKGTLIFKHFEYNADLGYRYHGLKLCSERDSAFSDLPLPPRVVPRSVGEDGGGVFYVKEDQQGLQSLWEYDVKTRAKWRLPGSVMEPGPIIDNVFVCGNSILLVGDDIGEGNWSVYTYSRLDEEWITLPPIELRNRKGLVLSLVDLRDGIVFRPDFNAQP